MNVITLYHNGLQNIGHYTRMSTNYCNLKIIFKLFDIFDLFDNIYLYI